METRIKRCRFQKRTHAVLATIAGPFLRWLYAFRCPKEGPIEGPFLLVANHVTAADPVLLAMALKKHMLYIVASEHLMQKGIGSKILRFLYDPIVRRKGDSAVKTVKEMLATLKAGLNVAVFPEGTCSYDGTNSPFLPTIGKLARSAKCALVTYRFEGGFFTLPRWGKGIRRGVFYGHVVHVYSPDALRAMRDDEINAHIEEDLNENAYARIREHPVAYKSRRRAELLESAFFLCPKCHGVGTLKTAGDRITCGCGLNASIDAHYALHGMPFTTLPEWDRLQTGWLNAATDKPDFAFCDEGVTLWENDDAHRRKALTSGTMRMTRETFSIGDRSFALSEIANMELVRRNLLVFSTHDAHYQAKGGDALNSRKYMLLYRIWKGVPTL